MDCAHVDDSYESYILGALDSDEMGSMAAHIDGCARCQAKLRPEAEAVAALAYAVPQQSAPASVKMRLFERIDASAAPDRRWDLAGFLDKIGARMVASYQMAVASSLVAVIVLGGVLVQQQARPGRPREPGAGHEGATDVGRRSRNERDGRSAAVSHLLGGCAGRVGQEALRPPTYRTAPAGWLWSLRRRPPR